MGNAVSEYDAIILGILFVIVCLCLLISIIRKHNKDKNEERMLSEQMNDKEKETASKPLFSNISIQQSSGEPETLLMESMNSNTEEHEIPVMVQKQDDIKQMIQLALKGKIRDDTKSKYSAVRTDDEYVSLLNRLQKEDKEGISLEHCLESIEICNLRYNFNEKCGDSRSMLDSVADLALLCVSYGYYEDAIRLARWHDGASYLAPMNWSGDLEKSIRRSVSFRMEQKQQKNQHQQKKRKH